MAVLSRVPGLSVGCIERPCTNPGGIIPASGGLIEVGREPKTGCMTLDGVRAWWPLDDTSVFSLAGTACGTEEASAADPAAAISASDIGPGAMLVSFWCVGFSFKRDSLYCCGMIGGIC